MTVYLAGPITGLSFKGATDWRAAAQFFLPSTDSHLRCHP